MLGRVHVLNARSTQITNIASSFPFLRARIIMARLPLPIRNFYKPQTIFMQAMVFDEFFYKTAHSVQEYQNFNTLDRRILQIAKKMMERRYPKLFVFFYMGD